jgi:predicted 3-demethylubiquinone-9 3-methyltransferase (glyoxalase superfamily)
MHKITPFRAGEAAKFYVSIFENSKVLHESPMEATFVLDGQTFHALNGGPQYKFTPAVSFFVSCETQAELDHL